MAGQRGADGKAGHEPAPAPGEGAATVDPVGPTPPGVERLREAYERVHPRLWRAVLGWSGSREVADEAIASGSRLRHQPWHA